MLGEKTACAAISPHSYLQRYLPLWLLRSDFLDFDHNVCHIMNFTIAERNPDLGLLIQQAFLL